jgi:hypothetical protein
VAVEIKLRGEFLGIDRAVSDRGRFMVKLWLCQEGWKVGVNCPDDEHDYLWLDILTLANDTPGSTYADLWRACLDRGSWTGEYRGFLTQVRKLQELDCVRGF